MTPAQLTAAESMYSALNVLPCCCEYNVPYANCKVERVVTRVCARCRSMAAWKLATATTASAVEQIT